MLELLQEFYLKNKESKFVFSGEDFEKKMDKIFIISPFPKYKKQIIELLGSEEIVFGIEETVSGILFTNRFFLLVGWKLGPKRYDYPLFLQLELSPKTFTKNGKYILDGNDMCDLGTTSKDFIELFESLKNTISQIDFSNPNHDQINPREIMENNDSTSKTISSDLSRKNKQQRKEDFDKLPKWKKGLIYGVFILGIIFFIRLGLPSSFGPENVYRIENVIDCNECYSSWYVKVVDENSGYFMSVGDDVSENQGCKLEFTYKKEDGNLNIYLGDISHVSGNCSNQFGGVYKRENGKWSNGNSFIGETSRVNVW